MNILVTGGAGYIGTHTLVCLLEANHKVFVLDNLINSNAKALKRVEIITNKPVSFFKGDVKDIEILRDIFKTNEIDAVIHFAALKAVGESSKSPLEYYQTNVQGTLSLLEAMKQAGINNFIYSSSATVYGESNPSPYKESMILGSPSSPYGASKVMVERILQDIAYSNKEFRCVSLRYFNPIGAHSSGLIGEDPNDIPNNLLPYITQVAAGKRLKLNIFGGDYLTEDGTCIRDYLHVMDLAEGHLAALNWLELEDDFRGVEAFNLGTGSGVSVMQIVASFESATNKIIPYEIVDRRRGDLPSFWADSTKAKSLLGWKPIRSLEDMMTDAWRWQSKNKNGYLDD